MKKFIATAVALASAAAFAALDFGGGGGDSFVVLNLRVASSVDLPAGATF